MPYGPPLQTGTRNKYELTTPWNLCVKLYFSNYQINQEKQKGLTSKLNGVIRITPWRKDEKTKDDFSEVTFFY